MSSFAPRKQRFPATFAERKATFRQLLFARCLRGPLGALFGGIALWLLPLASSLAADEFIQRELKPVLEQRCFGCHDNGGEPVGDANLGELLAEAKLGSNAEVLQSLLDVIEDQRMPPEDETPLKAGVRRRLLAGLKQQLERTIASSSVIRTTPLRRMTRFQYANAVKDLFELKVQVFPLPERMLREHGNYFQPKSGEVPDVVRVGSRPLGKSQMIEPRLGGVTPFPQDLRAEHGFDTRADHLTLSPLLLESFLRLSRSIVNSPDFNGETVGIWDSFFAEPKQQTEPVESVVRRRLQKFLTRAHRQPPDSSLVDRYVQHVVTQTSNSGNFVSAMKSAAAAAIASPRFLYLYEPPKDTKSADDYSLASRLSFFLWGSIPDERLLKLAKENRLHEQSVLLGEVERMLQDERLKRFCDSFPAQWLQLERIISSTPDRESFPQFYFAKYRASMHMMLEPLLLFETVLIEDLPILNFIHSDFSYRSDLLQAWYRDGTAGRVGPPTVITFHRVPVTDRREGGLITNAAVMTMTSSPTRTLPITRGAWVASVILNNPPEPPPADVPPLAEKPEADEQHLTLRERFSAHRDNTACAACHRTIDPLGFALENYNAAGVWRDTYDNGRPVDASGKLFGQRRFEDVVEFKDALLERKDRFTRAFTSHLLSFALARELDANDRLELDRIVSETAKQNHRFQPLIKEIVSSPLFLQDPATPRGIDTVQDTGAQQR